MKLIRRYLDDAAHITGKTTWVDAGIMPLSRAWYMVDSTLVPILTIASRLVKQICEID